MVAPVVVVWSPRGCRKHRLPVAEGGISTSGRLVPLAFSGGQRGCVGVEAVARRPLREKRSTTIRSPIECTEKLTLGAGWYGPSEYNGEHDQQHHCIDGNQPALEAQK